MDVIRRQRGRVPEAFRRLMAVLIVASISLGAAVVSGYSPPAAHALPEPPPAALWRVDFRGPAQLWKTPLAQGGGFATGNWNNGVRVGPSPANANVFDHVSSKAVWNGSTAETTTRFVSLTEDALYPYHGGFPGVEGVGGVPVWDRWVHKVEPTANIHSADSAIAAAKNSTDISIAERARDLEQKFGGQSEWLALDGVHPEQIEWAVKLPQQIVVESGPIPNWEGFGVSEERWLEFFRSGMEDPVLHGTVPNAEGTPLTLHKETNSAFAKPAPGDVPTRDPFPITELSQCGTRPGASDSLACGMWKEPSSAEELAELHGENFPEELGDLEFTTVESRLDGEAGVLLSPLTESTEVLRAVEAGSGVEGTGSLAVDLERSLAADLAVLEDVAAHPSTVSRALEAAGKVGAGVAELLPYAAIAATGYALEEDIKNGNWVDAGFDGAAEGLMVVGLAQPELMVFTEPALWVVLAVQFIVDRLTEGEIPPPQMSAWQREQADQALQEWADLPAVLAQMRVTVTEEQLIAATEHVMREKIIPALQTRITADYHVLRKLESTYIAETHRQAVRAAGGIPTGDAFEAVRGHRDAAFDTIEQAFAEQREARRAAYVSALGEQVQATADHFGLEWAGGSTVFDRIRVEFDEAVAGPSIGHVEGVLHEFSRYQDPPVVYPSSGVGEFREGLRVEKFAAYEEEFRRVFPDPVRVVMPADEAEYARLLAGKGPDGVVDHPVLWAPAVPGGETTITIHDPVHPVTGVMLLTVPDGLRILEVQAPGDRPVTINEGQESALVGTRGALVDFGGSAAPVTVTLGVDRGVPMGTLVGKMVIADDVKWPSTVLSRADLAVVVRDTLPGTHAFGAPGGVTEEVVIHGGRPPVAGQVVLTAPPGAMFEQVRSGEGAAGVLSPDRRVATLPDGTFGAQETVAVVSLRVPGDATTDQVFTGGRVEIVKDEVVRAAGGLTVSTHPVSVSQTVVPSLLPNTVGQATVRVSNHTENTVTGAEFTITAPSGAVFANARVSARTVSGTATHRGVLSEDGRSLAVSSDGIAIPGKGWIDYTITLLAETAGAGMVTDGVFAVIGGALHPAGGLATPVAFTSVIFPTQRLEAGPGKTTGLTLDLPTDIDGRIDVHFPAGVTFSDPKATGGYEAFYADGRRTLTVVRTDHSDTSPAKLTAKVTLDKDARPTHDYPGTIQITREGATTSAGAVNMRATTEGCITQENVRDAALWWWMVQAKLTNSCQAWIDATVDFARSTTNTVPVGPYTVRTGETVWFSDGNYSVPQPHRVNRVQPNPGDLPATPAKPVSAVPEIVINAEPGTETEHILHTRPYFLYDGAIITAPAGATFTAATASHNAVARISPDGKTIRVSHAENDAWPTIWFTTKTDLATPAAPANGNIIILHANSNLIGHGTITHNQ